MFDNIEDKLAKKVEENKEDISFSIQRTKAWHIKRIGRITGSKIPELMSPARGKAEFSSKALTYLKTKISERMLDPDQYDLYLNRIERSTGYPQMWGIDNEDNARKAFEAHTGKVVTPTDFVTHPKLDYYGGSSDGYIEEENRIIEIKCPYDPAKHLENFVSMATGHYVGDYYGQMQSNIECTGAEGCYFISYDPRCAKPLMFMYIARDEEYIAKMLDKVTKANDYITGAVNGFLKIDV